ADRRGDAANGVVAIAAVAEQRDGALHPARQHGLIDLRFGRRIDQLEAKRLEMQRLFPKTADKARNYAVREGISDLQGCLRQAAGCKSLRFTPERDGEESAVVEHAVGMPRL